MIKSAVTISLVPSLRGGPWILWDDLQTSCRKAAELGFDGVELFTEGPAAEGLDSILQETGLGLAAVGTGAGKVVHGLTLTDPDAAVRNKAQDFIRAMIHYQVDIALFTRAEARRNLIMHDPQAQYALTLFSEAEKLLQLKREPAVVAAVR